MLKTWFRFVKIKLVLCIEFFRRIVCGRGSSNANSQETSGNIGNGPGNDINFDQFIVVQGNGDIEEGHVARTEYIPSNVARSNQQQIPTTSSTSFGLF